MVKLVARWILAGFMLFAGINHFTNTNSFLAQVPPFLPAPDLIVYVSGVIEIGLGLSLLVLRQQRKVVGVVLATFFILIFPGNISQYVTGTPAFGLDSDVARLIRLFFQPVLVLWALWCTDVWPRRRTSNG